MWIPFRKIYGFLIYALDRLAIPHLNSRKGFSTDKSEVSIVAQTFSILPDTSLWRQVRTVLVLTNSFFEFRFL